MLRKIFFATVLLMVFSGAVLCEDKDRLAVMDIQDGESIFNSKVQIKVTDYIFTKFQITGVFLMIPKADRDTALEQAISDTAEGSRKQCVDEKCQISLTAQLQANFLINTEVKKLYEGTCQVSIRKFDVEKRAGVEAWEEKFDCTDKGLYGAIDGFNFGGKKKTFQTGRVSEQGMDIQIEEEDKTIVNFTSEPAGAIVLSDGIVLCPAGTPCAKRVSFGKHVISMQLDNYLPYEKEYNIKQGDAVTVKLEPNFGKLTVNSNMKGKEGSKDPLEGIEVKIDGTVVGKTPINGYILSHGGHELEINDRCFKGFKEKFIINRGEDKTLVYDMEPRNSGIKIDAENEAGNAVYADIYVDLNPVAIGKTGKMLTIPMCTQKIHLKGTDGEFIKELSLTEGETLKIEAVLKKEVVYTPPPQTASTTPTYNYSNYDYSYKSSGNWDVHGVMAIPVGATFDKAFIIGLDLGLELAYGSGSKRDFHRYFSFSLAGKMDFASDFNFDQGLLGIRSFDFKLNLKMNFWYLAGIGGQVEALLGMPGVPNRYLAGVTTWAFNLPIYLWTRDRSGFSITLLNVDIGWNYHDMSKGQIVFYTSFEFFLW